MIQDTVRNWVTSECSRSQALQWDEEGGLPAEKFQELAKLGFCGLTVPEAFGGQQAGIFNACLILEELAYVSVPLAIQFASSAILGSSALNDLGTGRQKNEFLPACVDGAIRIALAAGKPGDPFRPDARAPRLIQIGGHYRLSGVWNYVLLADQADLFIVAAMDSEALKEWSFFLIRPQKGVLVERIDTLGLKGSSVCRLKLDDVIVTPDDVLGGTGKIGRAKEQWEQLSGLRSLSCAFTAVGLTRGAFDYAVEYAKQRIQFKQPIGRFPAMREKLTAIEMEMSAARLLAYESAWSCDQGKDFTRKAYMAHSIALKVGRQAALDCLHILGGYGYTLEYDAQRILRDLLGLAAMNEKRGNLDERLGAYLGL